MGVADLHEKLSTAGRRNAIKSARIIHARLNLERALHVNSDKAPEPRLICQGCGTAPVSDDNPLTYRDEQFCILRCDCSEYPVVAGIPLLFPKRVAERTVYTSRLINLIRAGNNQQALLEALTPTNVVQESPRTLADKLMPSAMSKRRSLAKHRKLLENWQQKLLRLSAIRSPGSTIALLQHYFQGHNAGQPAADYFSYRLGQPKFLTTVSLALAMPELKGSAADLACGAGHFTRNLLHRNDGEPVYGIDQDFFLLWIANTRIAPAGRFICTDLEYGLPFSSGGLGSILMSNFFQFLHGKQQLIRESERALRKPDGVIMLSSVRHSGYATATPNRAIAAESYRKLFTLPNVVVSDDAILERYLNGLGPDLRESADSSKLNNSPMISLVASRNADAFQVHGEFTLPPHYAGAGSPRINPLYQPTPGSTHSSDLCSYNIVWPSKQYIEDNMGIRDLLPEVVVVKNSPKVAEEIASCALADYPDDY